MLISWYKRARMCVTSVPNGSGHKMCCHLSLSMTFIRSRIEVRSHVCADCPGEPLEPGRGEPPPSSSGSDRLGALLLCPHDQCAYPEQAPADPTRGGHVAGAPGARARRRCCGAGDVSARWCARG